MTLCFKQIKVKESTLEKHLGLLWSQMVGLFLLVMEPELRIQGLDLGKGRMC